MVLTWHFVILVLLLVTVWMQAASASASVEAVSHHRDKKRTRGVRRTPPKFRTRVLKGGSKGDSEDFPTAVPVVEPPVPHSTKAPSQSPIEEPAPTGQAKVPSSPPEPTPTQDNPDAAEPQPSPAVDPTAAPNSDVTGGTPAPSPIDLLSPSEVASEQARSRALLPFSLELSGEFRVDDVDQVLEMYLYERLAIPFSDLEWILLTVTSAERRERARSLVEKTFDFTGVAVFYESNNLPTEQEVQVEQLKALQDFHLLKGFVISQDYDWEIETIILDGLTITEDGMVLGDAEMENDGDTLVRGVDGSPVSTSDNNRVALALSLVAVFVLLGSIAWRAKGRRNGKEPPDSPAGMETLAGLMSKGDNDTGDGHNAKHTSFEAATIATKSFDSSMNVSGSEYRSEPSSMMDWNRVFALSRKPVEQTFGEVFEPKNIEPPKDHKTHEIVMLAPVTEGAGGMPTAEEMEGDEVQVREEIPGDEDSYGYNSVELNEGINASFILSSPVAPGEEGPDANYGDNNDLTIDLADFSPGGRFASNS